MAKEVDPRRWVNFRARGLARVLIYLQAYVEDVEGALAAGQLHEAAGCLRVALLLYLSILSLEQGSYLLDLTSEHDYINFDPIHGVDRDMARTVLGTVEAVLSADTADKRL